MRNLPEKLYTCEVCTDNKPIDDFTMLNCDHMCCTNCMKENFIS